MAALRFNLLKLAGFKSFVEPTLFQIEPGLTGVVGPNGCGKSNLLEAIRWVMGANSAKAMRAAGMDDVIFSGTKSRPGRNMASVTLTIDNKDRLAPAMFNDDEELEISRIITKGAGSKYKVNGKTVRAKDVQLLFADASTGANSPALVRQGQINELISAKPSNRRRILEEAAGISGLHSRRHEAELRLRAAETNLDRLEDVLGQIEAQLTSLRRQSRQATRYKRLAGEIREYRALLWLKRWEAALAALTKSETDLQEAETAVQDLTGKAANCTTQTANIADELPPHREEQIIAAAVCGRLNAARDALDNDEQSAKDELEKLRARLDFLKGDLEREEGIVNDAKQAKAKLTAEFETLKAAKDMSAAVEAAGQAAASAIAARTEIENELSALSARAAAQEAKQSGAAREIDQLTNREARLTSDHANVQQTLASLASQINQNESSLFSAAHQDAANTLAKARAEEQASQQARQESDVAERAARDAHNTARQAVAEARAGQKALASIVRNARNDSDWVPALEHLSVKKGFETALAAALGEDLEAGLEAGLPLRWDHAEVPQSTLPAGTHPLSEFVKAPSALAARLSQIGVTERDDGERLAKDLKPGQRLVSIEGDLWRWDGFRSSGDIPSTAALKLENKNRLAEIEDGLAALEAAEAEAETASQNARRARQDADAAAQAARQALRPAESAERAAQSSLSQFETAQARRSTEKANFEDRAARLVDELSETKARLAAAYEEQDALDTDANLHSNIENLQTALHGAREQADEAGGQYRSLRNEAEARAKRLAAVEQEIAAWEKRGKTASERLSGLQGREAQTETAYKTAISGPDEFATRRQTLLSELSNAEARSAAASDKLAEIETNLRAAEAAQRSAEQALGAAREARAAAQANHAAAQSRRDDTSARIAETLSCAPTALKEQLDELSADSNLAEHDIEKKLERLSKERENLGGVNLRADEEAAEQEERLSALNDERQDLLAAIARLREGIDNLNQEGRERLLKAFDTVNEHFGRLFVTLFGGGHASLALTESDDPLEAGLDVLVSPPGKKLGSMSLMSGGEQALTATALIFAVFLSNPAPICVLDEVDAPLDDANVERFCNLLDEMCRQTETRFMVITHNPVSMARMDRIFGVTMAEKGVSQLVSIDLKEAEKLTAA